MVSIGTGGRRSIAHRDPILGAYLKDVSRFPRLSIAEEGEIIRRIQAGDEGAVWELTRPNLLFVVSVARRYAEATGLPLADLVSEGNLGMVEAAKRFDGSRGARFISYAVYWVKNKILEAIVRDIDSLEIPTEDLTRIRKLAKVSNRLTHQLGRTPLPEEVAEAIGVAVHDLDRLFRPRNRTRSFSESIRKDGDGNGTLLDLIGDHDEKSRPDHHIGRIAPSEILAGILKRLSPIEKKVLWLAYGLGDLHKSLSISEVAEELGMSQAVVKRIQEKVFRRLKHSKEFQFARDEFVDQNQD